MISPCGSRVAVNSNSSSIPVAVAIAVAIAIASSRQRTIDHLRRAMITIVTVSVSSRSTVECGSIRHSRIIHLCAINILLFLVGWKTTGLFVVVVGRKKGKVVHAHRNREGAPST